MRLWTKNITIENEEKKKKEGMQPTRRWHSQYKNQAIEQSSLKARFFWA